MAIRTQCAIDALQDVGSWLEGGGEVAVSISVIILVVTKCIDGNWLNIILAGL